MIYYSPRITTGWTNPRPIKFPLAVGNIMLTNADEAKLHEVGFFGADCLPADPPPPLAPDEEYGKPVVQNGRVVVPVSKSAQRRTDHINLLAAQAFDDALAAGYDTGKGYVMQCDKPNYEMLHDGLQTVLDAPVELGGAGGDPSYIVTVVDKDNQPHQMTIAQAQQLATEVQRYYWQLWSRKQNYRQALMACQSIEEMEQVVF
ncbi:MAG: hypothetical protein Tsb0017_27210 [Geothermobacteraceae bacterium]